MKAKNLTKVLVVSLFTLTPVLFLQNRISRTHNAPKNSKSFELISKDSKSLNLSILGFVTAYSWLKWGWSLFRGTGNVFKSIENYSGMIYGYSAALFGFNLSNALLLRKLTGYVKDVVSKDPHYRIKTQKHWYFPETSFTLPNSPSKLNINLLPQPSLEGQEGWSNCCQSFLE